MFWKQPQSGATDLPTGNPSSGSRLRLDSRYEDEPSASCATTCPVSKYNDMSC